MSVGDTVKVQCGLEISREESNYFLKKNVKMKLFIPEKFEKLPLLSKKLSTFNLK